MPEHIYEKEDLIQRFDRILNKTFEQIDNVGMFEHVRKQEFNLQKGIAGTIVEQCVLGYDPDTKQEADLVVLDNGERKDTELKVTGMRISDTGGRHFVAKEPMSITAVGVYDLADQTFAFLEQARAYAHSVLPLSFRQGSDTLRIQGFSSKGLRVP